MKRLLGLLFFAASALALAQAPAKGVMKPLADVKFEQDEDVKCLTSALESGDPAKGPSTIVLKAPPKCLVPWHWHTAAEELIVIDGTVQTEMEGMTAHPLVRGGYARMPGKAKHQFSCQSKTDCVMFVTFDAKYDIFWVKDEKKPKK
jgi:quercetin dioxygenase-like cupin family protein